MKKRGISPLIATILIIGFTIVLAALVMTWGMDLYKSIREEQELKAETELICASKIAPVVKASCLRLLPYVKTEIQNNGENEITSFLIRLKNKETILKNFNFKISPYGVVKTVIPYKVNDIINEIEFIPNVTVKDKERSCSPFKFSTVNCDKADFKNLVGFWPMDEGYDNIVYDYVSNKDGTINGATWVNAKMGWGLSFDGNDYVTLPAVSFPVNNFSMIAGINKQSSGVGVILGDGWNFEFSSARCTSWGWPWSNSPGFNTDWVVRSCVWNASGSSYAAYANDIIGSIMVTGTQRVGAIYYMGRVSGNTGSSWLTGIIDFAAVYNKSLMPQEIAEIYNDLK